MAVDAILDGLVGWLADQLELSLWFAFAGMLLLVGEAFVPGGALMVVGTASLAAGVTGQLFGINGLLPLTVMLGVYGVIAFAGFKRFDVYGERGEQTSGADGLTGKEGVVKGTVTRDDGRVKLDSGGFNPYYEARSHSGDPIPEGERIRVVDPRGGNVLEVQPLSEYEPEGVDENSQTVTEGSPADK